MTKGYLYIVVLPPRRRQGLPPLPLLHHLQEAIYEEGASFSMYLWEDSSGGSGRKGQAHVFSSERELPSTDARSCNSCADGREQKCLSATLPLCSRRTQHRKQPAVHCSFHAKQQAYLHEQGGHRDGRQDQAGQRHKDRGSPGGGHEGVALSSAGHVGNHLGGLSLQGRKARDHADDQTADQEQAVT